MPFGSQKRRELTADPSGAVNDRGHVFKQGKCVHCTISEKTVRYLGVRCRKSPVVQAVVRTAARS